MYGEPCRSSSAFRVVGLSSCSSHQRSPRPSDVFREHFLTCFISDPVGVQLRHHIGIDNIAWECDYPHSDSSWPEAPEELHESDLPNTFREVFRSRSQGRASGELELEEEHVPG